MTWWKKLLSIFKSEAADVKEGLSNVGRSLDAELAKKEAELAATPAERIDMILEEIESNDPLHEIEAKIKGSQAELDGIDEVEETSTTATDRDPPADT